MLIFVGTFATQLSAGPVQEKKHTDTGKISVAAAAKVHNEASSKDQDSSSTARIGLKQKRSEPNPERGMYNSSGFLYYI